jgi:hypothetical protein
MHVGLADCLSQLAPFSIRPLGGEHDNAGVHQLNKGQLGMLTPASYQTRSGDVAIPRLDDLDYIQTELGLPRLQAIGHWLWLAGRPSAPRPLHNQLLLNREIFITERMDMHAVWTTGRIFLKPMPRFLLEPSFWREHLACERGCGCKESHAECTRRRLWKSALGFLFSYAALVSHESDYFIAIDKHLFPAEMTWQDWRTLVGQLDLELMASKIDRRFLYGELRLGRLNKIFRFTRRSFQGRDLPNWGPDERVQLASAIAYIALVLTAMQVGLATNALRDNDSFHSASYGFTILTILGPLVAIVLLLAALCGMFALNWWRIVKYNKLRLRRMGVTQ